MSQTNNGHAPVSGQHADRGLFRYWDGEKVVHGDPLEINRLLYGAVGGNLAELLASVRSKEVEAAEPAAWADAAGRLIEAVRYAFAMLPFDRATGMGATERDCREALWAFLIWEGEQRAHFASPPTSPPSSAPQCSTSPTPSSTGCGST